MNSNEKYLKKLHSEILTIMDEIHRVCVENNINYYLCAGTLLGAIRHNGFIPWDDDLDIAMPRKDFRKFIEIAPSKLGDQFYLEWETTNKKYYKPFPKVCLKNTLFQEECDLGGVYEYNQGIFVDIFPMDVTTNNFKKISKRKNLFQKWCVVLAGKHRYDSRNILKRVFVRLVSKALCYKKLESIATKKERGANCYTRFSSQYPAERICNEISWFDNKKLHEFEDRQYYVPGDSESILKQLFGVKYLELPPFEKRRTHYPKKVIFSDGMVLEFDSVSNKISIEDTLN